MATKVWTLTADFTPADATKIDVSGDQVQLKQVAFPEAFAAALDTTNKWSAETEAGDPGTIDWNGSGALLITIPDSPPSTQASKDRRYMSTPRLQGDFSMEISFANWSAGAAKDETAQIIVYPDGVTEDYSGVMTNCAVLYLHHTAANDEEFGSNIRDAGTPTYVNVARTNTYGGLRIARSGDVITLSTKDGTGAWTQHAQQTVASALWTASPRNVRVGFQGTIGAALGVFTVDFDDLVLNSGTMINGYFQDLPYWDFAAFEPGGSFAVDMSTFVVTTGGTGSVQYCYATKPVGGVYGAYSAWMSLATLQAESDPTGLTGFKLRGRFTSDGTQTATLQDASINYTAGTIWDVAASLSVTFTPAASEVGIFECAATAGITFTPAALEIAIFECAGTINVTFSPTAASLLYPRARIGFIWNVTAPPPTTNISEAPHVHLGLDTTDVKLPAPASGRERSAGIWGVVGKYSGGATFAFKNDPIQYAGKLVFEALTAAETTALISFFQTTAEGMGKTWTYIGPDATEYVARFTTPNLELTKISDEQWDVTCDVELSAIES